MRRWMDISIRSARGLTGRSPPSTSTTINRLKRASFSFSSNPSDYQVALDQAGAQLAQAEADLNSARQQYVSAGATVNQDEAQNYLAQRNAQRYSQLIKQQIVSQSEFDQFDATARAQDATVKRDQAAAGSAERIIASKEALVKQAQANVDQAGLNLSYTRIVAPADGIIGNRSAQLGQRVQPGQSLMALTQHQFWVTANFKETQLAKMRAGQPVTIHVDAIGRDLKGRVENMPGATGSLYDLLPPENATGNSRRHRAAAAGTNPSSTTARTCHNCGPECQWSQRYGCAKGQHCRSSNSGWPLAGESSAREANDSTGDGLNQSSAPPSQVKPRYNPWAIALTVTLATFMEVLDTSIANVSLPHIAGAVGQRRREHLGAHLLPCRQRDRAADQRVAGASDASVST